MTRGRMGPGGAALRCIGASVCLAACSPEYGLRDGAPEPPAIVLEPADPAGEPPEDWDCRTAWWGTYYNLAAADTGAVDDAAFERLDPTLDFGPGVWPVDQGWAGDPAGFAVVWRAWLRTWERGPVGFVVGASGRATLTVGDDPVWSVRDARFQPEAVEVELSAGVRPITVRWWSTRTDESGFRLRLIGDGARVCPSAE